MLLAAAGGAHAQAPTADQDSLEQVTGPLAEMADRRVRAIVLRQPADNGAFAPLEPTLETMARQQIRTAAGSALDPQMLLRDRRTLDRLGRFRRIVVEAVPQDDGSVRQTWEISRDGGATWGTVFDGHYVRKED